MDRERDKHKPPSSCQVWRTAQGGKPFSGANPVKILHMYRLAIDHTLYDNRNKRV
jgi:hypothetical protein